MKTRTCPAQHPRRLGLAVGTPAMLIGLADSRGGLMLFCWAQLQRYASHAKHRSRSVAVMRYWPFCCLSITGFPILTLHSFPIGCVPVDVSIAVRDWVVVSTAGARMHVVMTAITVWPFHFTVCFIHGLLTQTFTRRSLYYLPAGGAVPRCLTRGSAVMLFFTFPRRGV